MSHPPSGPFQQAISKIPLMKVCWRIGFFIRNYMEDEPKITAESLINKQNEVFDDFVFSESFEVIMLLFMLSRYDYLDHISRDQGYTINPQLFEDFPQIDEWHEMHPEFSQTLDRVGSKDRMLELMFRRRTWFTSTRFTSLDLGDLLIAELDPDIFTSFPHLEELYLNNNLLGTLPDDIFHPLKKLKKLNLSYNMIGELPIHIFSENQRLQSLNIANNGIDHRWLQKFKALNRLSHGNLEIII